MFDSVGLVRWTTVDDATGEDVAAPALFDADALADRHVGRGEFRGMEFLHVNAKRIISEVPGASAMPFRYTINPYRGCSHACAYCLAGDTPILMADGRTRRLADVRPGDRVYGTVRVGSDRRYALTTVIDHWSTVEAAWRVSLADGTELIAGGDHRFLTERGWKYVTGTPQGSRRRPHLTTGNDLLGTGAFARGEKETPSYRRGYLCGVIRGGAQCDLEVLDRTQMYLAALAIDISAGAAIRSLVAWPQAPEPDWRRGFLAGIFDAEGSFSRGILRITNADRAILDHVTSCLRTFGFDAVEDRMRPNGVTAVRIGAGLREHLRFFHTVQPAIARKQSIDGAAIESDAPLGVVAVEPLGVEMPLYDITTTTGDFIADGVVSHNCFARPTHEYLGLGIGEDFDRKIVVKVNAVERLRAELAAKRWAGDRIAMGTNTDPYQRCEGKYHLTQGIVRVLTDAANPFSILTKSTLVLRDLDLLAEAAARRLVRVNLSIGTLDEDVWRLTEPGTPPPQARVDAVRRLNAAGVPCGVLVAPVLPGLSDGDDVLRAVVDACVDAGAVTLSTVLLHLRGGVRDHYLDRLRESRPELAAATEARYRTAYLPKREQQDLAERVAAMVAAAGGSGRSSWESPRRLRSVDGDVTERVRQQTGASGRAAEARSRAGHPTARGREEPEQLGLGW